MTQLPDDDHPLITFLKAYRPAPPPAALNLEMQLIAQVKRDSRSQKRRFYQFVWFIPTAIAASVLLSWGSNRWLQPSLPIASHSEELDAFLVESWNGTVEDSSTFSTHPVTSEWLLLSDTDSPNNSNP